MGENQLYNNAQKLPAEMVYIKKVALKILQKESKENTCGKHLYQSLFFNKVAGFRLI